MIIVMAASAAHTSVITFFLSFTPSFARAARTAAGNVFGTTEYYLCIWHVFRAWRRKVPPVGLIPKALRLRVMAALRHLVVKSTCENVEELVEEIAY